jgi:hypothetical protein
MNMESQMSVFDWLDEVHRRRAKLDAIDHIIAWRNNDPFGELVRQRLMRLDETVIEKDPHAALWLITAEVRRHHPLLFARHRVLNFLERFT